ncbi:MAG: hypothetical protein KJ768_01005, partial [Acidobacteria bacterium]|nr:hypothetical protein [Acidobacteriota bacterium]
MRPLYGSRLSMTVATAALFLAFFSPQATAAQKVPIHFESYHGYTATADYLKTVAKAYSGITDLLEIGKSTMGRPIYVLVVSNQKNGATHGNEYTGTEVCLYIIDKLVSGYGEDETVTRMVDKNTFYICPVINPDSVFNSVERGIPQRANSMNRDEDGDGKRGEDPEAGIDLNRNFPEGWFTDDGFAGGTGDYPTSAPETHAVAEFFSNHRNILMGQFYHTSGGFTFRPMGTAPHSTMNPLDVAVFDFVMGKKYLEIIGEDVPEAWEKPQLLNQFREKLKKTNANKYAQQYGIYSITTELWNPLKDIPGLPEIKGASDSTERALLAYQDEEYGGKLFRAWKPFKHPDLGEGEIGGWLPQHRVNNALPGKPLVEVCDKHWRFELFRAELLPDITITKADTRLLSTTA